MAHFAHNGPIGVSLTETPAGTGTSSDEGNEFALGSVVTAQDSAIYMRVHASAAIAQYDFVGIDENYEAAPLTAAMAGDGWQIGAAQVALADNDFGWVAVKGSNIKGAFAASCAADVALYTTGTAGTLDDATGTLINGVVCVLTPGTAAAEAEVIMSWPKASGF
jgi:hypothetical protein